MHAQKAALVSTAYFGPVQYFSKFLVHKTRVIEICDHYSKQTYRNRCNIYGANGILTLSIPVLKGHGHKTKVKDIKIDGSKKWQKLHWKGIQSAYSHSPFFEFYMDEIQSLVMNSHQYLLDLNTEILRVMLSHLDIDTEFSLTSEFAEYPGDTAMDYRDLIHPKAELSEDPHFKVIPYQQVFGEKHGFLPNLSILDLLFNEGPNSRMIIEKSIV
jgi:hypothetical protein